ncbi:hypothetical protein KY290_016729 [Solanum tuberosum]|uniref:Ulp1 protease family, C-terminal catalytic domain containing protein n=1 Tax=Solanum tuberosum TaxID=4113 RepID=A0ABQ7VB69_SOLTU|nr:hypothetical protein KY284_016011 [Solanum tuberosum]KAH0760656.1 hypothetical protein KY290_016729 [Solanum tuberosum]
MYRLNRFSYALNNWVYECAFIIHNEIAIKEGNGIPRICNWKVVGAKPKFEMFMKNIFTENDCSNVQPTQEKIRSLDLPNNSHVPPTQPATSVVNHKEVQPDKVPGFEEFSSKPLEQLLRRSTRVSTTESTPPPKRRKVAHPTKNNVPKATQPDEQPNQPFQTSNSHPPQVDNDNGGISMPHIVDDSVDKDNVDPQSASDQFFQQIISPIQMNFATVDHGVDASVVEVEKRHVIEENIAKEHAMKDSTDVIPTAYHSNVPVEEIVHNKEVEDAVHEAPQLHTKVLSGDEDVAYTIQQDFEKYASNPDSTTSASISSGTEAVIDAIVYKLPNEPINVAPLSVIIPLQLIDSDDFLSDNQLPTQLPVKESAHNLDTKTPAPRNRMPSKIL